MFRYASMFLVVLVAVSGQAKEKSQPARTTTLLVVPAADREAANAVCLQISPYARDTFSVKFVDDKNKEFYVASWSMTASQLATFRQLMAAKITSKKIQVFTQSRSAATSAGKFKGKSSAKLKTLKLTAVDKQAEKEPEKESEKKIKDQSSADQPPISKEGTK